MKLKSTLLVVSSLLVGALSSNAANIAISNLAGGAGVDTLYASNTGALMNGGVVALGYFGAGVTVGQITLSPNWCLFWEVLQYLRP